MSYTSVWGVFLLLLWTVFDRWVSSRLDKSIDWHSEKLDFLLSTDDEELFLNRLEKISRSQADYLKTLLTDALKRAMQSVVATIQHSQGNIQSAFGSEQCLSLFANGRKKFANTGCMCILREKVEESDNVEKGGWSAYAFCL